VLTVCLPTGRARLSKRNRRNGRGLKLIINKLTVKDASGRHQKLHLGLVELAALLTCCVEVGVELQPVESVRPAGLQLRRPTKRSGSAGLARQLTGPPSPGRLSVTQPPDKVTTNPKRGRCAAVSDRTTHLFWQDKERAAWTVFRYVVSCLKAMTLEARSAGKSLR
jgi:hypothetical protein